MTDCTACDGVGEIGTHQNAWGIWETEECRVCYGTGEAANEPAKDSLSKRLLRRLRGHR